MALINISNLNVADTDSVTSSNSFLTELQATDSSQIFGGSGHGNEHGKKNKKGKGYGHGGKGKGHGYGGYGDDDCYCDD